MIVFYFIVKICKRLINAVFGESDRSEARAFVAACVLIFAVVLIAFGIIISQCGACRRRRTEQKIDRLDGQISNANLPAGAANEAKREANAQSVNAEIIVNQARENVNRARNINVQNINGRDLDKMAANYEK